MCAALGAARRQECLAKRRPGSFLAVQVAALEPASPTRFGSRRDAIRYTLGNIGSRAARRAIGLETRARTAGGLHFLRNDVQPLAGSIARGTHHPPVSARDDISSDFPVQLEALPNPRGGSVRLAEMALADALHAFQRQSETASALKRAIAALHSAGRLPATLCGGARAGRATRRGIGPDARSDRGCAVGVRRGGRAPQSARAVLLDCVVRSLSRAAFAAGNHTRIAPVSYDDLALAGRAIAPATLLDVAPDRLACIRLTTRMRCSSYCARTLAKARSITRGSTNVWANWAAPIPTISGISR